MSSCIKKTKMRGQGSKPRISKKLNLDDVCGLQNDSFKNKRTFQNHYRRGLATGEELLVLRVRVRDFSGLRYCDRLSF